MCLENTIMRRKCYSPGKVSALAKDRIIKVMAKERFCSSNNNSGMGDS
jgi:hypothetical protein